jgi:hypothetical protein
MAAWLLLFCGYWLGNCREASFETRGGRSSKICVEKLIPKLSKTRGAHQTKIASSKQYFKLEISF